MTRKLSANHILWRDGDRVPITPKAFDVLAYLVEHAGQVVSQDELLRALWPETFVNPEVLRKYILEVRKALGDRPNNPEFIATLRKRGYRFVAPVTDRVHKPAGGGKFGGNSAQSVMSSPIETICYEYYSIPDGATKIVKTDE